MYENGIKVSRYHRQREHKRRMKERFLKDWYGAALNMSYDEFLASLDEDQRSYSYGAHKNHMPSCECYWRHSYLSGPRQYAKEQTNNKVRSYYRQCLAEFFEEGDLEDYDIDMTGTNVHKMFDFWNCLY